MKIRQQRRCNMGRGAGSYRQWEVVREPSDTPYAPTGSQYQFMTDYLEPPSDVIWGSAGAIITAEGEVDLQPTTEGLA